jgi:hypothetical protein
MLLAVPIKSVYAESLIYVDISNDELKEIGVVDNNLYYFEQSNKSAYVGEQDFYDESGIYTIEIYNKFNSLVYGEQGVASRIAFGFDEDKGTVKIYKNSNLIITQELSFCNHNKKCESCNSDASTCANFESSITCPDDCATGSDDNYCDLAKDGICDPDCEGHDMDCSSCSDPESDNVCYYNTEEFRCMYEYIGVSCNLSQVCAGQDAESITMDDGTLCCVDSYCVSKEIKKEQTAPWQNNEKDIEKYVELEKGVEEEVITEPAEDITTYGSYLLVFVAIAIIIGVFALLRFWKMKHNSNYKEVKYKSDDKIYPEVTKLHLQGMNYSRIKQQMIRKGYDEKEIDKAIEAHFKTKKQRIIKEE